MTASDKKFLAIMPKLNSRRVDVLLEDVLGCRWTISVLRAVGGGVNRPGALERHIEGISAKGPFLLDVRIDPTVPSPIVADRIKSLQRQARGGADS